ncbi:MAG TPA: hypothetical protein PKV62_07895, partial [Oscillospiraceae bacterium]|nr:hypothetical protein [Oscillospiraceae bacterium]
WTRWLAAASSPFVSASITAKVDRAMREAATAEPTFTARACALLAWHAASFIPPTDRWATDLSVENGQAHLPDGTPFTAHSTNPVPFIVFNHPCRLRKGGRLADIAPTMLRLLGLPQPPEMTGKSLLTD